MRAYIQTRLPSACLKKKRGLEFLLKREILIIALWESSVALVRFWEAGASDWWLMVVGKVSLRFAAGWFGNY